MTSEPAAASGSRVLVAAAIAAALTPLNSTMIAVALPALGAEFGVAAASVTVSVVTGYLIATIVCQMPAGSVADRLGYGHALTLGRWIFAAGSLAAVVSPALWGVVVGRLLMAAGGSLMVPTAMALLRVAVPAERRARAFGTMGAVMGGAAAVGPAVGGLILARFGWRSLFVINLPLIVASWLFQGRVAGLARVARVHARFDWLGTGLLGTSLVMLITASRASGMRASGLAIGGLLLFAALLVHERRTHAPVLDLALFRRGGFVAGASVIAFQNLAMYSLLVLVPFLFGGGGRGRAGLSLAIMAMTAMMAISSPIGGWLSEWVGLRMSICAGGLLGALGIASLAGLAPSASASAVGARLLAVGLGLGLSTGPAQAGALGAVDAQQSGMASAALAMLRYVGGIAGTVILGYAMAGGAGIASRESSALWIFAGAFLASAACGVALSSTRHHAPVPAGRHEREFGEPPHPATGRS